MSCEQHVMTRRKTAKNIILDHVILIGTGKIGLATLRILKGFGMKLLAYDPYPNQAVLDLGVKLKSKYSIS